jgi:hypothetical protein
LIDRLNAWSVRHWKLIVVLFWLAYAAYALFSKWGQIRGFALGDTDDNLRMAQVRGLLDGQDWFDLVQYRLDPVHGGADIHWSRLVDLPLAGLMLLLRPFVGGPDAERWAAAIAPLLAFLPMLFALALITRRLVGKSAVPLVLLAVIFAASTLGMVQPLRIDHHGWQLAMLALALSGLADPDRRRGGIVTGLASAASLAIGLELLIYLAVMGAAHVLFWVADRAERARLLAYAVSLSGGTTVAFLSFASYANRAALCDALSPVWLGDALVGGALMAGLAMIRVERWTLRLALAAAAGLVVLAFHAFASPHCLTRLEGVSAEATELWLSHVREARPIYLHGRNTIGLVLSLPIAGLLGYSLLAWGARRDPDLLRRILAVALTALVAMLLLFWQTRAGPAAQMMALPGAIAIAFILGPLAFNSGKPLISVPGTVLAVVIGVGALGPLIVRQLPSKPSTPSQKAGRSRQPHLPKPARNGGRGPSAAGDRVQLRRSWTAHHCRHQARRDRRPLSSQRPGHRRRHEGLSRRRSAGAAHHQRIWQPLSARMPQHVDRNHLPGRRSQRLLHAINQGPRPRVADPDRPRPEVPLPDVEGEALGEQREALLEAIDDELGGKRGEDHAQDARDHGFDLGTDQPHQRARRKQCKQG